MGAATVVGGCFGCVDANFEKLPGLAEVISGYSHVGCALPTSTKPFPSSRAGVAPASGALF